MRLKDQIAALEQRIQDTNRQYQAMAEWFVCESRGHAVNTLDVAGVGDDAVIRVHIHGMGRASGGVAVVQHGEYRDFPRYLDDVILEWERDPCEPIRCAARVLAARRAEYCKVA